MQLLLWSKNKILYSAYIYISQLKITKSEQHPTTLLLQHQKFMSDFKRGCLDSYRSDSMQEI